MPDGLLGPHTAFALNGQPYEALLGGSADDPLIRLLSRGSAGYRTAAKALQYALQGPLVTVESISDIDDRSMREARLRIGGRLRGSDAVFTFQVTLTMTFAGERLLHAHVACPEGDLKLIAAARKN